MSSSRSWPTGCPCGVAHGSVSVHLQLTPGSRSACLWLTHGSPSDLFCFTQGSPLAHPGSLRFSPPLALSELPFLSSLGTQGFCSVLLWLIKWRPFSSPLIGLLQAPGLYLTHCSDQLSSSSLWILVQLVLGSFTGSRLVYLWLTPRSRSVRPWLTVGSSTARLWLINDSHGRSTSLSQVF